MPISPAGGSSSSQLTNNEVLTVQNISGLGDPNADRILFWDESSGVGGAYAFLTVGSGLQIVGTTLSATGGGGTGDVVGPASSTDNAIARFDLATGKLIQNSGVIIDDSNNITGVNSVRIANTGLTIFDTDASHVLSIIPGSNITANRTLTLVTGDANRTITLAGDLTFAAAFTTSGANALTLTTTGATNVTLPTTGTLVNTAVTTLSSLVSIGTITTGVWNATVIAGQYGGTGVANTGKTITLGGNLTTSGSFDLTLTLTGSTNVTLPTTGTLATQAGTETLSNKTLTAPRIANAGFIADANGNELLIFTTTASAVNEITIANAATTTNPSLTLSGGDTNIGLNITPKGTGVVGIRGNATQAGTLSLYEDTGSGTNFSALRGSPRSSDITYLMPTADPTAGQVMSAGAPSGNVSQLSWIAAGGASAPKTSFSTVFENSGGFSINLVSGTAGFDTGGLLLSTTVTGSKSAEVSRNGVGNSNNPFLGSPTLSITFVCFVPTVAFGSMTVGGATSSTATTAHFGFMVDVVAGVATLSASQASGSAQTKTTLTTITGSSDNVEVYAKVNGTSSIDYYWRKNGGAWSSATNIATNMPTGTNLPILDLFVTNTTGNMQLRFENYTYERN